MLPAPRVDGVECYCTGISPLQPCSFGHLVYKGHPHVSPVGDGPLEGMLLADGQLRSKHVVDCAWLEDAFVFAKQRNKHLYKVLGGAVQSNASALVPWIQRPQTRGGLEVLACGRSGRKARQGAYTTRRCRGRTKGEALHSHRLNNAYVNELPQPEVLGVDTLNQLADPVEVAPVLPALTGTEQQRNGKPRVACRF